MITHPGIQRVAHRHDATPAQIAIAWVLRHPDVLTIPKAGRPEHVHENHGALDIRLSPEDLRDLDRVFEPPRRKLRLAVI